MIRGIFNAARLVTVPYSTASPAVVIALEFLRIRK